MLPASLFVAVVIGFATFVPQGEPLLLRFRDFLTAAVGQIDLSALRLWQSRGGFSQTLARGGLGTDVRLIQTSLATDPTIYPEGVVSGYFGQLTQNALLRFQDQYYLALTGMFDVATRETLNQIFFHELCPVGDATQPDLSLMLVTRTNGLPSSYIPRNLVDISRQVSTQGIMCTQEQTARALEDLYSAARAEGVTLRICSGYRGPDIQEYVARQWFALEGSSSVNMVSICHTL